MLKYNSMKPTSRTFIKKKKDKITQYWTKTCEN